MLTEDYVSFVTAKLLKEKGFNWWCFKCYGVAVLHNGADISFDEECDLKDEGRENEIEYVEGGRLYDYGCDNRDKDAKVWAAPTLWAAMKWLREVHNMHIEIEAIKPHGRDVLLRSAVPLDGVKYHASIVYIDKWDEDLNEFKWKGIPSSDSYEQACEAAIKYCLKNLI